MTDEPTIPTVPAAFRDWVSSFRADVAGASSGSEVGTVDIVGVGSIVPYGKKKERTGYFPHEVALEIASLPVEDCPEAFTLDGKTWRAFGPYALRPIGDVPEGEDVAFRLGEIARFSRTGGRAAFEIGDMPRTPGKTWGDRLHRSGQDGSHRVRDDGKTDAAALASRMGDLTVRVGNVYYRLDTPPRIVVVDGRSVRLRKEDPYSRPEWHRESEPLPLAALTSESFLGFLGTASGEVTLDEAFERPSTWLDKMYGKKVGDTVTEWKSVPMSDVVEIHDVDACRALASTAPPPRARTEVELSEFAPSGLATAHMDTLEAWVALRRSYDADPTSFPTALRRFVEDAHPEDGNDLRRAAWTVMLENAADEIWPDPTHRASAALDVLTPGM